MASKVVASIALFLISFNLIFLFPFLVGSIDNPSSNGNGGEFNGNFRSLPTLLLPNAATFFGGSNNRCNPSKLGLCANLLGSVKAEAGSTTNPCCSLIEGLAELEAAICLCTAVRVNALAGLINLDLPVSLSVLHNNCGRRPTNFDYQCRR